MDDNQDEYEETLIYVDLDDIPSVDELFAVEPDDFLTCQSKRQREIPQPKKSLHPQLALKFYNLDSNTPILQLGSRYYSGEYEEPMGSYLMFQDKTAPSQQEDTSTNFPSSSSSIGPRSRIARMQQKRKFPSTPKSLSKLKSIVPELKPPPDKVYGEKLCTAEHPEFELVANVQKVLRMRRTEVFYHGENPIVLPPTPSGQPVPIPDEKRLKTSNIIAGKYHMDKNINLPPSSQNNDLKVKSIVSASSVKPTSSSSTNTGDKKSTTASILSVTSTDNNIDPISSSAEILSSNDSTTATTTTTSASSSMSSSKINTKTKSSTKKITAKTLPKTIPKTTTGKSTTTTMATTKTTGKTPPQTATKTSSNKRKVTKPSPTTTTSTRPTRNVKKK